MKPLLDRNHRIKYWFLIAFWAGCLVWFWVWWLQPDHVQSPVRYAIITAALFWLCLLPFYYLTIFVRARIPETGRNIDPDLRIAMVVTKAPSEPFSIVRTTLEAMLAQDVPHDTWLADEDPAGETLNWCRKNGVRVSTRKGVEAYHRKNWPRRTRCKEGNLAFFYDHYGYENYDFVSQLDADHVPQPGYLRRILEPFSDPQVGYVSAPSICNKNQQKSWAARSRLHTEALFHGTLQAGYSNGWAPMCIGSHYAVRTRALRAIGGLGPELAEDHSTSMMMNAHGWRGVHAFDAIATGDGPATFPDMATQEFQWARSLVTILFSHTPALLRSLPWKLKFQFLFCQMIYPLISLFMLGTFLLPIYALVMDVTYANISFPDFLLHFVPMTLILMVFAVCLKRDGYLRPFDAKVISWEKAVFHAAQWPWMLAGSTAAVWDRLTGKTVDFRVTPKGDQTGQNLPLRILFPYAALSIASAIPVLLVDGLENAAGFYIFAAMNAVIYAVLLMIIIIAHYRESPERANPALGQFVPQVTGSAAILLLGIALVPMRGLDGLDALARGIGPLQLTEVNYQVSGAGIRKPKVVRFKFNWKATEKQ